MRYSDTAHCIFFFFVYEVIKNNGRALICKMHVHCQSSYPIGCLDAKEKGALAPSTKKFLKSIENLGSWYLERCPASLSPQLPRATPLSRCSLHIWNANTSLQLHRPLLQKGSGALYSSMSMWVSWPSGVRTSQQIWSQFTAQQCAETYHLGCTDFWMWKQRPAKGLQESQAVNPWAYPYLTGETASWTN